MTQDNQINKKSPMLGGTLLYQP